MKDFENIDYFTDASLVEDPHPYFDYLRDRGPVTRLKNRDAVAVTGFEEAIQISRDTEHFSSVNSVIGPVVDLPFEVKGDDISAEIEGHRGQIPFAKEVVTLDGSEHSKLRSLLTPLFTPSKLVALEKNLRAISDQLIDEFIEAGEMELVTGYGGPFATLIITELLGIPKEDRELFRDFLKEGTLGDVNAPGMANSHNPLVKMGMKIAEYMMDRRANPRDDILTYLATTRFPDGELPTIEQVTRLGAFLFGAGQDTTARLLANLFRILAERRDLQEVLRANPDKIPKVVDEALRYEGSVKASGRLCIRSTTVGGVEIKAGDKVALFYMAANRDPRRFPNPAEFDLDRPRNMDHIGFGRGPHTCIGAPLARLETRVSIEKLLGRLGELRVSEKHHGPAGERQFRYKPTYVLRALSRLHLEFTPGKRTVQ